MPDTVLPPRGTGHIARNPAVPRPTPTSTLNSTQAALRIAGAYGLLAFLWILLSDRVLELIVRNPDQLTRGQTFKGWFFVAVTTGLLAWLTRNLWRQTERVHAALQVSETKYRRLTEDMPALVCTFLADSTLTYVNPACARLANAQPEALIGRHFLDWVPESDRDRVRKGYRSLTPERPTMTHEHRAQRPDGTVIWLRWTNRALFDAAGKPTHYQAIGEDVTEQRRIQAALAEGEARYRQLFESHPHPMWVYDLESLAFLAVNEVAVRHYGFSREEFLALTIKDIRPPEDIPAMLEIVARHREGLTEAGVWRHRRKDGSLIDVEITSHGITFAGRPARVVMALDVTARRRAELALRASEEKFSLAFDCSPVALSIVRVQDGIILHVNEGFEQLFGYTSTEAVGRTTLDLGLWDNPEERARRIEEVQRRGAVRNVEVAARNRAGQRLVCLGSSALIVLGGERCILTAARDITDRKQREAELRQSREQLRALAARLEAVREEESRRIAREVHDQIGQAFTSLNIDLAWLRTRALAASDPHTTARIQNRLERMSRVVRDSLQTVQRISAELRPGVLDDLGLAEAVEWQTRQFAERTGIRCTLEPASLPNPIDPERATTAFRILQEALTNVARHAHASLVTVQLQDQQGVLRLEVQDDGSGLPAERLADPHALGLVGMRERALAVGGSLELQSAPGRGTRVVLTLPNAPLSPAPPLHSESPSI